MKAGDIAVMMSTLKVCTCKMISECSQCTDFTRCLRGSNRGTDRQHTILEEGQIVIVVSNGAVYHDGAIWALGHSQYKQLKKIA